MAATPQRNRASEAARRWKEEQAREESSMVLSGRIWKVVASVNMVRSRRSIAQSELTGAGR